MPRARMHLSLTGQVALLSLIPILALGVILAEVLQSRIVSRTLADAGESAQLVAHLGIQPRLTPRELRGGLSSQEIRSLDEQLRELAMSEDTVVARCGSQSRETRGIDERRAFALAREDSAR